MTSIQFICHGYSCRSLMAKFAMKDLVRKARLENQFHIKSAASCTEATGDFVYLPAQCMLAEHGINCAGKADRQITSVDYDKYDLLIGMDWANLWNMLHICGGDPEGKMHLLMEVIGHLSDVAESWYMDDSSPGIPPTVLHSRNSQYSFGRQFLLDTMAHGSKHPQGLP